MLSKFKRLAVAAFLAAETLILVNADLAIYSDGQLAQGWENWSWSSTINFAATDLFEGVSSIFVNSTAYAALSVKYEGTFPNYAGLRFDIAGDQPDLSITIQSTGDNDQSPSIALSSISQAITANAFTSLLINFNDLPGSGSQLTGNDTWDRITFQAGGNGAVYYIDNIVLVEEIVIPPLILSAEPLVNNIIAVTTQGSVDFSALKVSLNGAAVAISNTTTYVPIDTPALSITYLTLASSLAPGNLVVTAGNFTSNFSLPAVQYGSIVQGNNAPINPHIYGVNFPSSASYIQHLGVTISRWGGNAVTAYNPNGDFTNAGNDWYFENRDADDGNADAWVGWVSGAGSDSLLTIPALDWVAKDNTSYSYPATTYPDQQSFDPYNSNAGDGLFPNGSYITPAPSQTNAYTPWNTASAQTWLAGLKNKPTIVTVDNEIEIASNTHQDMHPQPIGYDEELSRVIKTATAAKAALPNVLVAAPSTCSWWYYWTSIIGYSDNAAHNNIDFLPWFLGQMKQAEQTAGKRLLDYLDIHYYFQPDVTVINSTTNALRLRMSRSLWDPSYTDESWIGEPGQQNHQWNPTNVYLIPRFQTLIEQNYPGTKLSISEWSSTADTDISGGLLTVDVLGIFGRYKLDSATYWATPDETGPIGLAYWLYRGYGVYFGSSTAQVNLANPNPDTLGVYAGTEGGNKLTLVIVNKDPANTVSLALSNVPTGSYFLRHFGGQAGVAKWQTDITITSNSYIVVPPYTAIFLQQQCTAPCINW